MIVIASNVHRGHHSLELSRGELLPSAESPSRADFIADALRTAGHQFIEPTEVDRSVLTAVHTAEYIDFLSTVWERWILRPNHASVAMPFAWPSRGVDAVRPDEIVGQLGYNSFAADCSFVEGTWRAIREAASIAQTAADLVSAGESVAYGLCRPPGHHATADQFGGYCYVNNAAVAAQRLLDTGRSRVAILDIDYHHGNGTQSIFYDRADVLFVSIHADPAEEFPWFSGRATETGAGSGEGANINLPLARGSDYAQWSSALDQALRDIQAAGVDALVVSLGVDTYEHDPLGTFTLSTDNFSTVAARIGSLGAPMVLLQEGGYAVEDLGHNVAAFLEPLS